MIIGAFYWAMVLFGGVLVLIGVIGVADQFVDHFDPGSLAITTAIGLVGAALVTYSARNLRHGYGGFYGVRAGPGFSRDRMARNGCLFIILVVGAAMLLYLPAILLQLPEISADEQGGFLIGAVISFFLGAVMVGFSGRLLWRGRGQGRHPEHSDSDDPN